MPQLLRSRRPASPDDGARAREFLPSPARTLRMHWYLLLLRLTHIALGAIWVGTMVFMVVFLTPALRDAGPAGAPIMGSLQRRGFMVVMPVLALLTIISGFLLVERI